ncbi:MAG: hypothetical protein R3A50_06910 [Saprospiraceae bacterium]
MTEPQELRSIDELFRNTFNNLPDTPADSGWDTPSDRVWQHVNEHMPVSKTGWGLKSILLFAGFAAIIALGLYLTLSTNEEPVPATNNIELEKTTSVADQAVVEVPPVSESETPEIAVPQKKAAAKVKTSSQKVKEHNKSVEDEVAFTHEQRQSGAAPLPGTSSVKPPNTTEELKLERARQLEELWKTPLEPLPVPSSKDTKK